jgi:hypothetical protein
MGGERACANREPGGQQPESSHSRRRCARTLSIRVVEYACRASAFLPGRSLSSEAIVGYGSSGATAPVASMSRN